jgi:peptidoglycan/xylan/chitin deacetylase (PgdA/CDA1 family)
MSDGSRLAGAHPSLVDRLVALALRPARARGAVVLAFHQIDAAKFEGWVRLLSRHFELVSLDELLRRHKAGESLSGLLAITFDDGWADACEPVARLCAHHRWPVLIYLVSGALTSRTSLWFAELPALLDAASGRRVEAGGFVLDMSTRSRARRSTSDLVKRLKRLTGSAALHVVGQLRIAAGLSPLDSGAAFVDTSFTERYRESEWVRFGSHTVDHQAMAAQHPSAIDSQCRESKRELEDILGQPVRHLAYPYGAPSEVGTVAPSIARRHYASAVTMVRGICDSRADAAALPRVPLYDRDGNVRMIAKIALAPWL